VSGRIGKSAVTPGALVTAGQATALATVQQGPDLRGPHPVQRRRAAPARAFEAGQIRQAGRNQAAVTLILEDGSRYGREGRLQFTDTRTKAPARCPARRLPQPRGELLPGMYVRAALQEGVADRPCWCPSAACRAT
jgi:membrane fusion protein (multidrug efflux system)